MIDSEIVNGLKKRYPEMNPLMFQRSVERAKSPGHLFDLLEGMPKKFPIVWNEKQATWETTEDISQVQKFNFGELNV